MPLRRRYGRFRRRAFRNRRFRRSRRMNGRRFSMRRAMRRRVQRPELKYFQADSGTDIDANAAASINMTPLSVPQGPGVSERIGNRIKYMTVRWHLLLYSDISTTATRYGQFVRVIIASPRMDQNDFLNYFQTQLIPSTQFVPWGVAKVYMDKVYPLINPVANIFGGAAVPSGEKMMRVLQGNIAFPRVVQFAPGDNDVQDHADVMYMFIYNMGGTAVTGMDVAYILRIRTTFIDV